MRLLQLALKPPYPKIDGGCVAIAQMAENIAATGMKISSVSISTKKHPFQRAKFSEKWLTSIPTFNVFVNVTPSITAAFFNLFSQKSYPIHRFYSKELEHFLSTHLQEQAYDIIQFESSYLLSYLSVIQKYSNAKLVLRSHNLEHELLQQKAEKSSFFFKKYLLTQANRMKREETELAQSCDGVVTISLHEKSFFEQNTTTQCIHIPLSIEIGSHQFTSKKDFFHIGAMDWAPNSEGIEWFLKNVWQKKECNNQQLHLAGKNIPPTIQEGFKLVINHGEVSDAHIFMSSKGIMIVPLFSGSGIRVKILEAGSLGIPIIATQKAVEGLGLRKNIDYLEANDASSFLLEMERLEADIDLQKQLSLSIQETIRKNYDTTNLTQQLLAFYQDI